MAFNATYFIETLPRAYDDWSLADRVSYLNDNLNGFSSLENSTQVSENVLNCTMLQTAHMLTYTVYVWMGPQANV